MAELKIFGKTVKEIGEAAKAKREALNESFKKKSPTSADNVDRELEGRPANPDFPGKLGISPSDKVGPKFNMPKKVTKETVTVEGDRGSVDRDNPDVVGPDMGKVNVAAPVESKPDMDPMDQARKMMGFKKGGKVKSKCGGGKMSSGGKVSRSSASKRADGIAQKGHTKGKYL